MLYSLAGKQYFIALPFTFIVYCRCPNEELSIDKKMLILCVGPGSIPCECTGSGENCVVSIQYMQYNQQW